MSITNEYPIMAMKPKHETVGESVLSPTSATDPRNSGGMPPKMTQEEIFSGNQPPPKPAESSVADLGESGYSGKGKS